MRRLADRREGFGQQFVERLAARQPLAEQLGLAAQLIVAERRNRRLERVDRIDIFAEPADIAVVGRSEDALCQSGEHEIPLNAEARLKGETACPRASGCGRDVGTRPVLVN